MTITQLKDLLGRKFRGDTIDDIQGISDYSLFEEAAGNLLAELDPYETVRHGEINIFNEVYDYSLTGVAPDLKDKKIIDIRPQGRRNDTDFRQTFTEDFDRDKEYKNQWFSVEFDEATKFLRINKDVSNSVTFTDLESGNYTAGTGVSNITEDTILYAGYDTKSIRFDVSSGSNLLEWNGDSTIDLSDHTQKSSFFLLVYYPDSSIITSLILRVGSSSANYYEITGQIHFGSIKTGWNLYRFDWNGVSDSGTTDETVMDYARFALVTTSSDTDIRIGKLSSKLPSPHEIVYYSNAIFRPTSGSTWLTKPTANTDIINLEHASQNLFIYECCELIAEDQQLDQERDKFHKKLFGTGERGQNSNSGLYGAYRHAKPSEGIRPTTRWYSTPRRNNFRGIR